jgi:glycosyltransferase involved in cell wall biosynthesis
MEANKISVALATYNEEANLSDCLDSVKDWVSQIVVVDGGSTDETVQIAGKYKAQVIKTDNPPIFHINKQKAIDACNGDWILQLDADERVSPGLKDEILQIVSSSNPENGYWLPRKNYFLGCYLTKGGQYPDYTLRLYRKGKWHLPCKSVHEQAVVEGRVGYLKNDLLHNADPNFSRYLLRFDRYTSLIATELADKHLKINIRNGINYIFIKPIWWFLLTFFRHKGILDGFPGFIFSWFSGLRFAVAYIKYWEKSSLKHEH